MRLTHTIVPGLLAGTMLVAGTSGTFAAKTAKAPRAKAAAHLVLEAGQISNLTTAGFTLTWTPKRAALQPKVFQVALATKTKEAAVKGTTGALQNGEYAIVVGTRATTGLNARTVRYSTKAFAARTVAIARARLRLAQLTAPRVRAIVGTISPTAAPAGEIAITTKAGKTHAFAVTATTKFVVNKALQTAAPAFTAGEKVRVIFKFDRATKAFNALRVAVLTA